MIKATAGEVSDKAKEARSRLMVALESAKERCEELQEKAVAGAKATDKVIRDHPYESIGVASASACSSACWWGAAGIEPRDRGRLSAGNWVSALQAPSRDRS